MKSYVVLDLETTGLNPANDRILEIGAVKIEDDRVADTYQTLLNPKIQIPYRIQELTGITQEMVESGADSREALLDFLDFCGELPLLGHNIRFDHSFVKQKAANEGKKFEKEAVDTLKIARKVLPELPSRGLEALCSHYRINPGNSHRALDDARSTWELYKILKRDFGEAYPALFVPAPLVYKAKKQAGITPSQKLYLNDLIKYHRIDTEVEIEKLTKSEASKMIDRIILNYGRIMR